MSPTVPVPLVLVSKSTWFPNVRREHAWASLAVRRGHDVLFVERPGDMRMIRGVGPRRWAGDLRGRSHKPESSTTIEVLERTTVLPGHRSPGAGRLNAQLLQRVLRARTPPNASLVCSWPWDWPAVARTPAARRVFDMADDWGELMPGRRERFASLYADIAEQADAVIVVNPALAKRFPGRTPLVIRNGVDAALVWGERPDRPASKTMVYVGTLTPRFDDQLVAQVLQRLPEWRLELVGQALYPGCGDRPSSGLSDLLRMEGDRVHWHGPKDRATSISLLEQGTVAIAPNRPERSLGQDSMKFYDYAALGMPIVSTTWFDPAADVPPVLLCADSPEAFSEAVLSAAGRRSDAAALQREWAAENTWDHRWNAWAAAVFGGSA